MTDSVYTRRAAWTQGGWLLPAVFLLQILAVAVSGYAHDSVRVADIVQLPAGVLCAALLLCAVNRWLGVVVTALVAHALAAVLLAPGQFGAALFEAGYVAFAAVCAAAVVCWHLSPGRALASFETMAWLMLPANALASLAAGLFATAGAMLMHGAPWSWTSLVQAAVPVAVAILVVTPFVVSIGDESTPVRAGPRASRMFAGLVLLTLFIAACVFLYATPLARPASAWQVPIVLMPLLVWAVFIFDLRFVAALCIVQAAFAVGGTLHGFGRFSPNPPAGFADYSALQLYLGFATFSSLVLAVVAGEWRNVANRLRESNRRIRAYLDNSMDAIWCIELDEPMPLSLPAEQQVDWILQNGWFSEANSETEAFHRAYCDDHAPLVGRRIDDSRVFREGQNRVLIEEFVASNYVVRGARASATRMDGTTGTFENNVSGDIQNGCLLRLWGSQTDITGELRARERLEQTERRFYMAFNSAPLSVTLTDMETLTYLDVNKGFERQHGYRRDEVVGRSSVELGIWVDAARREKVGETLRREGVVRDFEMRFRTKSGELRTGLFSAEVFKLGERDVTVSSIMDVTELRNAEEALRQSEERFSKAFNKSPDAIVLTESDTDRYVDVNEAFERFSGYRRSEVIGRTPQELARWYEPEKFEEARKQFERTGSMTNVELTFRHRNGERRIGMVSSDRIEMNHDMYVLSTIRDMTEQRKAESELQKSRELIAKAFSSSPDAISVSELSSGLFLEVNEGFLDMTGLTRDEVIGRRAPETGIWPSVEDRERIVDAMRRRGRVSQAEIELRNWAGELLTVSFSGELIEIDGRACMVSVCRDMTRRKQLDRMLDAYQHKLKTLASKLTLAEEAVRRQTATELHDGLCQDLAAVILRLGVHRGTLQNKEKIDAIDRVIGVLKRSMRSARSIVADLSQQQMVERGLGPAIRSMTARFAGQHGLKFEMHDDSGQSELADSVKTVLYRSVRELLANVAKHANASKIVVHIESRDGEMVVSVADNGAGLGAAQSDPGGEDAGYGLFSIRQQVEWLGGRMEVSPRRRAGTIVKLYAPLQELATADADSVSAEEVH